LAGRRRRLADFPRAKSTGPAEGENAMTRNTMLAAGILLLASGTAYADAEKPYQVEWVYRVRYGHQDEWWKIFQKYQIAILDREKELGYVKSYIVERPSLHTSEDARWDFRVVITYSDYAGATHERDVENGLFPDRPTREREEQTRWELTLNHWDLPIHDIDPHGDGG
jgi:hypothetical protein